MGSAFARPETEVYGADSSIPDYILGITFEIWEQRQIQKILQYYSKDVTVYSLDGITRSAEQMVVQTREMLSAFPDRLLIGDDVIWTGTTQRGFSSHRVYSPMTHLGDTAHGAASGRSVQIMNIADCEIRNGVITREWLMRDNLALLSQLGLDPLQAARNACRDFDPSLEAWLASEFKRVFESVPQGEARVPVTCQGTDTEFADAVLGNLWTRGDQAALETIYAPYCVLHRAPVRTVSGREPILAHYAGWRRAFPDARLSIDHACSLPCHGEERHMAVRWSVAGHHEDAFAACQPTGRPVLVLGATHWRILEGRIIREWTVFDELALMTQVLRETQ